MEANSRSVPLNSLAAAIGVLAAAVLMTAWAISGSRGVLYLGVVGFSSLCGLPWGLALFGRRHAAGWLSGAIFGYWATGFIWWAVAVAGGVPGSWWVAAWIACTAASWWATARWRAGAPLVPLARWSRKDSLALVLALALVPALVGRPFAQIGRPDANGNQRYRAYFTADFVWHMALVEELAKRAQPPVNPYLASERLHYYWTYFLVPTGAGVGLSELTASKALAVNALWCGLLFVAMLFMGAWAAVPGRPMLAALAVALVFLCGSVEGLTALAYVWWKALPLEFLRGINVDALPAWVFHGLRIDNLPRALWYTPQHAMAFSAGTVALLVSMGGAGILARAITLAGVALGITFTLNPFVGAVFSAVYSVVIALDAYRTGAVRILVRHAAAGAPIVLALAWCAFNQVTTGSGSGLVFGWWGPATNAPFQTLSASFLPAAVPALAGWWFGRSGSTTRITPAVAGVVISLVLMFTVALRVDAHWVGFRTGHLIFGFLPPLVAWGYVRLSNARWRHATVWLTSAIVITGLPTTVIDAFDAQDTDYTAMGPGFHWTQLLTPAQQQGLDWIRTNTPEDAVVQAEPRIRGREAWSLIPSFAGRRMAAGQPISLMHVPAYDTGSDAVREIYGTADAARACALTRQLEIDYLYFDRTDRAAYPGLTKFDTRPDCFVPVFRNREVIIYAAR